nr:hypothetical protein [Bacteroidota bacterium]
MKSKLLPISLFVLILGFTTIILASGWVDNPPARVNQQGNSAMQASLDYLNKLRANQVTGKIDPLDVMNARLQVEQMQLKSGNELGLGWEEMGPDNAPGRVRAILVDEKADNDQTLIVAGVSGGFWKTENLGATWAKLNKENENLYITCMAQAPDGTIYAGSGEAFCSDNDTYYGGFVGQGMYISGDRNNFTLLTSTVPVVTQENDTVDWAYINKIAIDMEGRIYAATNTGLFYSDDKGSSWMKAVKYVYDTAYFDVTLAIDTSIMCDSWDTTGGVFVATNKQYEVDTTVYTRAESSRINEILEFGKEMCTDVKVADDGQVFATIGNLVYSAPKATMVFTNHSHNPDNPDIISQEKNIFTTTLHAIDTLGQEYIRGVLNYTETLPFEPFVDYTIVQTSAGFALVNAISPLSFNPGRTSVAIAPSDNNVVYVLGSDQFGTLDNIYVSENRGLTWEIIFPGGSNLEIFDGTSCFNNTISVFPEDPYRLLVGGEDMWYGIKYAGGGYYNWGAGPITNGFNVPSGHHQYVFARNSNSKIAIATNRGVSFGIINTAGNYDFQNFVRGLSNTQSYTVGISGTKHGLLTGAQDNGTFYISGYGNTHTSSIKIDNFIGGSCAISLIDTNAFLFGRYNPSIGAGQKNFILRSEDKGANTSFNFTINAGTIFKAPFTLWESFDDQTSPDSVKYKAGKGYSKGDKIYAESANAGYPIPYVLTDTLHQGDSIYVNDYIQAKFFVALAGGIFVTKDVIKFGREINVGSGNLRSNNIWKIADASGFPTCIS